MSTVPRAEWRAKFDEWLAGHRGVISLRQADALGVPERAVHRALARGELLAVHPGVFRSRTWPDEREQQMTAALARNDGAMLAFHTAAALWRARRLPSDPKIHVLVPHGSSPKLGDVVVHRCRRIDPVDISERDGFRLTSPPRTLFDIADILGVDAAASVLEQWIDLGRGTFETHVDTWVRLGKPRRPGTRTMTAVLRSRPAWRTALQSDLESRVVDEIKRQGLPIPDAQFRQQLPSGRTIRIDFAWPEAKVALEVDHPFWHATFDEWRRDRARDRELMTLGWLVPRITDIEVGDRLERSVAEVAAVLASRVGAL